MKSFVKMLPLAIILSPLFLTASPSWAMTVSYEQKVSVGDQVIANVKVVNRENSMRAESDFSGLKTVMLRNTKGLFSYLPAQNMATQIPAAMDRPNLSKDIPRFGDFLKSVSAVKSGEEKVGEYSCDVYTFTEPMIQRQAKAWVWKEKTFPVKIEVDAPEGKTTIDIVNINFSPEIKDSDFELPEGVKLVDFTPPGANPAAARGAKAPGADRIAEFKKRMEERMKNSGNTPAPPLGALEAADEAQKRASGN